MRFRYAFPALVGVALAVAPAGALPPTIEVPPKVTATVGDFAAVRVTTDGPAVAFYPLTPGLRLFPSELLNDRKTAVVTAVAPGVYKLLCYTGNTDGPSKAVVVEITFTPDGPAPPLPVPPGPGPAPPIPPAPVDPLAKAMADAFSSEQGADKRERLRAFVPVMRDAATLATAATYTNSAQLAAEVTARRKVAVADSLPAVRAAIGAQLGGMFGMDVHDMTPEFREKVKAAYTRIADALETIK